MKPWRQDWLIAAAVYPGFCSMKRPDVCVLPLDGMLVYRRSLPAIFLGLQQEFAGNSFIHLGGERHCESKVSCPRTQHSSTAIARTPTARSGVERTKNEVTVPPTRHDWYIYLTCTRLQSGSFCLLSYYFCVLGPLLAVPARFDVTYLL